MLFCLLLLEEKLNTASLSKEVAMFVELLWGEAIDCLDDDFTENLLEKFSINDVTRAEGLLLQAQRKMQEANNVEAFSLLKEVYMLLHIPAPCPPPSAKLISQKLDHCQLLRDVWNVGEIVLQNGSFSTVGMYRALRCGIEAVPPAGSEFQAVAALLQDSKVQIRQVLRVSRGVELQTFNSKLGNVKPLLHSSTPSNFLGILSRGLLLPHVGVKHHGIERTDVGMLGSGIYFSNSMRTSLKYSKPSETDGSRLLLVCDVALGQCKNVNKKDPTLTQAPEGYHSVHGRCSTPRIHTDFEDDEFVVYSPDQVKLKYVVQFSVDGDELREFNRSMDTPVELFAPSSGEVLSSNEDGVETSKDPLDDVAAGLMDSSGQQLPLQAVNIKCKLMDMLSQVIIFQKYTNLSSVPIEAKYVFPLDDSAAVCGFEAFINGKHVVGQVEEKEKARKEYKKAIEKGHGAYLMDQDAPDVFTISVGNLPPAATVLIKVTFVSELIIKDGSVFFFLPGSVAPWQQSAALNQTTQVTVEKVRVTDQGESTREFTLDMSIEMPYEITNLQCITHKIKMKRTDCKAVVSVLPGEVLGPDGFQLSITLSEIHLPRMWVENHPDRDSQACMLVFYPEFDITSKSTSDEVVFLLDASGSMCKETLRDARRIALQVLKTLDRNLRVNVIIFSTDHTEAFVKAEPLVTSFQAAENFIKSSPLVRANTELWRPLRALSLLPPSRGIRNLLLLSDGHIQNAELTLQLLRDGVQHTRLFTCGLSPTANRHMLRALAQAGGGAYEFFDTKTKHNWVEKVTRQVNRMASPCCSSVSVKWQQFNPAAPTPVQAPKQLHALFTDCHTLVYGFVPHCTQATLLGNLNGQELETMLSTTELQKTKGTFLHKLTARAIIRDYEDGSLDPNEVEHEGKKAELKSFIIHLSKEFSILSQFTSFVAIEERDSKQGEEDFTDIPKLIAEEDVDILPYIGWISPEDKEKEEETYDKCVLGLIMSAPKKYFQEEDELSVGYYCAPDYESEDDDKWVDFDSPILCSELKFQSKEEDMVLAGDSGAPDYALELQSEDDDMEVVLDSLSPCYALRKEDKGCYPVQMRKQMASRKHKKESPPPPPPPPPPAPPRRPAPCSAPRLPKPLRLSKDSGVFQKFSALAKPSSPVHSVSSLKSFDRPFRHHFGPSPPLPVISLEGIFRPPPPAPPPPAGASAPPVFIPLQGSLPDMSVQSRHSERIAAVPEFRPCSFVGTFGQASAYETCHDTMGTLFEPEFMNSADNLLSSLAAPQHVPSPYGATVSDSLTATKRAISFGATPAYAFHESAPFVSLASAEGAAPSSPPEQPKLLLRRRAKFHGVTKRTFQDDPDEPKFNTRKLRMMKNASLLMGPIRLESLDEPQEVFKRRSGSPAEKKLKWVEIFQMQHSEGYWELDTDLGELLNIDVDSFANVFLKNKGILSLGVTAHTNILRLVATLLVLQLMRLEELEEGKLLRTLFCLKETSEPRPEWWEAVKKAVVWVNWADRQYPCIYSRLEFGWSWESSTRQLLGYDDIPAFSSLRDLNLQKTAAPVLVH
ncbi:protein mono-ADP-ribosyltransferase PARP4 [Thalassophryne amazonica]|uniref:protein mono-ADP-ribosyltransferase PARP4 n=1 Tax=Thalassophryne amazonica TaxID=390379 RepID=UPI001470BF91|nr:protein mono-ADP-ribosyltransferase PARP4 [Thalassophryne amazonica]